MADGQKDIFLSCFKCGRIVKAGDSECPRCGLQFGPGTLFECPFCSGLVWRNASKCSTCGIDLTEFSLGVEKTFAGFDMDEFVENIINTELEQLKSTRRRVACPGCGLMIRGDEDKCPRCDLPLGEVSVICPVCGEKMQIDAKSCPNCMAVFEEVEVPETAAEVASEIATDEIELAESPPAAEVKEKTKAPAKRKAPPKKKAPRKAPSKKKSSPKTPASGKKTKKKSSSKSTKGSGEKKPPSSKSKGR